MRLTIGLLIMVAIAPHGNQVDPPTARDLEGSPVVHLEDGHYHMSVHRRKDGSLWRDVELSEHYSPIVERVSEVPLTITVFEPQPQR